MKRLFLILLLSVLLIVNFAIAEPRIWTLSNINPDGGGTPIPGPFGGIFSGTFTVHLVMDVDGDGPDPVQETGQDIGMPGDDDELLVSSMQIAPSEFYQPAGVFTVFLTFDTEVLSLPDDAVYYTRIFESTDMELGTRYVNSFSFSAPDYPGAAQTVVELPERMLGYIGNGSPIVVVFPANPVVLAGDQLTLSVAVSDDEEPIVSVDATYLPGGIESILIDDIDPEDVEVHWAVPLTAEGDHDLTLLISDGDLVISHIVPVTVQAPDMRPSAFQPITPVDGGTSWQGYTTLWQESEHPQALDISYTFIWASDPEFTDADSVFGLAEPGVELYFSENAGQRTRDLLNRTRPSITLSTVESAVSAVNDQRRASSLSLIAGSSILPDDFVAPERTNRHRSSISLDPSEIGNELTEIETIIYTSIVQGETFFWTVRAVAQDGTDRYSPIQSAVAEIPDTPLPTTPIEPGDQTTVVTTEPVFRWYAAFDADVNDTLTYDLIWSGDGGASYDTVFAIQDTLFDMRVESLDFVGVETLQAWLSEEAERQYNSLEFSSVPASPVIQSNTDFGKASQVSKPSVRSERSKTAATRSKSSSRVRTMREVVVENDSPIVDAVPDHATITWFVEAIDATGNRSDPSVTWTFEVDAPDLPSGFDAISPADSLIVYDLLSVNLNWTESTDNDPGQEVAYDVLATSDPNVEELTDFMVFAEGLQTTSFTLPTDLQDDLEWRWTVRAISAGDTVLMHNGPLHVFVTRNDPPNEFDLTYPEQGALVATTTPMLEWQESEDGDLFDNVSYNLEWSLDEWATTSLVELDSTRYLLNIGLNDGDQVWWNVLAVDTNTDGRWAVPDSSYTFTIFIDDPPSPFALTAPDSGFVVTEPVFTASWQPSVDPEEAGPVEYTVEFSDDPLFTEPVEFEAGEETVLVVQSGLLTVGDQWWRVIAEDATGQSTFSTNTWTVYVEYSSVPEWRDGIPTEFAIARSYPNPFNPVITVVLAAPKPGARVELTMHNVLGREVARVNWTPAAPGYKPVSIDMTGHSSGLYFLNMSADGQNITTQRVTFLK